MNKIKYLSFFIFLALSCSGGSESLPAPDDGGGDDNTNPYDFPNAINYNVANQIEVVTWNIRQFPQHSSTKEQVKSLLEIWNADIYLMQEISSESELISMVNAMPNYSYVMDEESGNLGFALVYKNENVTYVSKNELWADTSNSSSGCNGDYLNCKLYQFASRPPMESYLTWTDGTKTMNLYVINVHYKCCGSDSYDANDLTNEATRRHHASLLLTDYLLNNRENDNVILVGDFNNVGSQSITNPTLSPFTDSNSFDSADSFRLTDLNILEGPASGYSWQGWTSSYAPSHLDHIIINEPLFSYQAASSVEVIALPTQTGVSNTNVSNRISDHQPVIYRFYP
tara:strand:- start:451 stop:1473 length:1023 start_codon:yes stop_codon:yes gene_type:complete